MEGVVTMKDGEESLDTEEIAVAAYNKIDALLDLLIKKRIITEGEYEDAEQALWDELESDSDEEEK